MAGYHAIAIADWREEDERLIESDEEWFRRGPRCSWRPVKPRHEADPWEDLPFQLDHIRKAIIASKEILKLRDEEADGDFLCDESTWRRAVSFLARNAYRLFTDYGVAIPGPEITPGPDGSVDLRWESDSYELLLNVRSDSLAPAGFYGDDKGHLKIKGTLDLSAYNEGLLLWLAKRAF